MDNVDDLYQQNLELLEKLYRDHSSQATNILNAASRVCKSGQHEKDKQQYRKLYNWIFDVTQFLDKYGCKLVQRVHWILNKLDDFPLCIECNKPITDPKQFKNVQQGYRPFCCNKCAKHHGAILSKSIRLKQNNGKYFSKESIEKAKQTFISHYGVDNNMKCEKGKQELKASIEKKYGKGITNVFQAQSIIQKCKKTKFERHGDENWNNKHKAAQTCANKSQEELDRAQEKRRSTCLQKYGVDHWAKVPEIRDKSIRNRRYALYVIDGYQFDSMPEFCFYIVCRDFKISIQVHPIDKAIDYVDSLGKQHRYYPDFYMPSIGRIIEIKGDHFFKDYDTTKELICRFGKDDNSHKAKAKYDAMIQNNVLILTSNRYMMYYRWVCRKYSKKWILSFRQSKNHKQSHRSKHMHEVNNIN